MTWAHSDDGEFKSAGWLSRCVVGVAVLVLPVGHRARYDEEFRSELVELPRRDQPGHALRLLCGCWSLRREVIAAAPHRQPLRRSVISVGAAVLVIAFSGVALAAKSAQPGDQLWGVTQVLYSDHARSVEAAAFARTEFNQALTALRAGKPETAKASLRRIQRQLPVIAEAEGRTDLTARHYDLETMLVDSSGPG